jgi:hypothetical protein
VYLERAIAALRGHGIKIEDESLAHLSPIGWEHINLTGDYTWQATGRLATTNLAASSARAGRAELLELLL